MGSNLFFSYSGATRAHETLIRLRAETFPRDPLSSLVHRTRRRWYGTPATISIDSVPMPQQGVRSYDLLTAARALFCYYGRHARACHTMNSVNARLPLKAVISSYYL